MKAYTGFASVYDIFMDNVPYEEWTNYLTDLLHQYGVKDGVVLELGCGTGNVTRLLADKGYDMIGIDNSYEMLEIARYREYEDYEDYEDYDMDEGYEDYDDGVIEDCKELNNLYDANEIDSTSPKEEDDYVHSDSKDTYNELVESDYTLGETKNMNNTIYYLEQDMRSFELFGTVGAIVSICDSMNYITTDEDLLKVFRLVNNYLDKDGVFIFDMNTEYKYKEILGDRTIAENRDDCSFIWENEYHEDKQINEYLVTIYAEADKDDKGGSLYERFEETHYQKAYSIVRIKELIEESGLEFVTVYDAFTYNEPTSTSERVYFIAKEKKQEGKTYI